MIDQNGVFTTCRLIQHKFSNLLARFLIPPSTNNRVNNRRNNNQEYLELNIGAPRSINRAKQRVVALIPSNDPAHSKRRHDLIFQNILPEILDIHRGRMGGKGMWNRRLKLGGKERKEEGGKKIPFLPPVDLVGIPWSPCANPGNRCFSWWSRELGRGIHKREI